MPQWLKRWLPKPGPRPAIPPETPLSELRFVVLDTEFTSLDKRSNRLLSIGAIAMQGASIRMGEQFYRVLNPGVEVPAETILVHKLRPHDVEQGQAPLEALHALRDFIADSVLVGHFLKLDLDILRKELSDTAHTIDNPAVCTAQAHRWLLHRERFTEDLFHRLENVSLAALAQLYKIEFHEAHHALDDAFVTARLWQKLLPELEKHGIQTLRDLKKISRP
jgi:DNA polymerase III subunit epsilon